MRVAILFLLICSAVQADPLLDLRTTLAGLNGQEPVKASAAFVFWNRSGDDKAPVIEEAKIKAWAEDGPQGLRISWSRDLIQTVAAEMRARAEDPEKKTPTRRAMDELNATRLNDYLNAAPGMLLKLEQAQLVEEKAGTWQGKPARLLTFKLTPPLSDHDRKYIKELEVTAKVWLGADGIPVAAESRSRMKGRALLVITFESAEDEAFDFARVGNRLVIVRHVKDSHNSGAGENSQQKTTANLSFNES